MAGDYAGFADVAASALHAETRGELTDAQVQAVVAGFGNLTPQPDAASAVRGAREAGARVFTLSNGAAATTQALLVLRLRFDLVEGGAAAADLGDDVLGGGFPDEWFRVLVPVLGPGGDRGGELGDAGEHAAA